jgi:hypothetical protein
MLPSQETEVMSNTPSTDESKTEVPFGEVLWTGITSTGKTRIDAERIDKAIVDNRANINQ